MAEYDTLILHKKEKHVIVEMNNGKVNAINNPFVVDLLASFRALATDDTVHGVILTGRPHCFSAGLDIRALATNGMEGTKIFWVNYFNLLKIMINFPKPLVAAITGYAPAAGTTLALCTDYRIMGRGLKHVMGLNEFNMSLQIPEFMCDIYAYYLGHHEAWNAIQEVKMYNSDEAFEAGLVNQSVEVDEVLPLAEKRLVKMMKVLPHVFSITKLYSNKHLAKIMDIEPEQYLAPIIENQQHPATAKMIASFMEALKKK